LQFEAVSRFDPESKKVVEQILDSMILLLTHNTKHFTQAVAKRTGLRITAPAEFFRTLASLLR
jgi:hypothetical protein